ncbi:TonB family protein [Acinetobacter sp. MD2(2019)]|uniref:energy transducer TonB n=1 Tax=Acinetobacter sp. MD2(2019) TaxID=2605273 RepID=UPI002D1EC5DA|nr:TonB family protein [Acinetobacter sp. MD2(2019)]MEB3754684.1 TonB family protein [Acinetobacter sp. MD2(2019)]
MSHSTVFNEHQPDSGMKKKLIIALVAVVVGHLGVLWTLSHMKVREIKPIHKEPLKVRFVKIQPPPAPPKPKELPKPKPKPVKEVKIVKQQLPPPPKKVEKVEKVKAETPKQVVQQPVVKPPISSTTVSETKTVVKPADPAPVKPVVQPSPPAEKSTKSVAIGGSGVQWSRSPRVNVSSSDLKGSPRSVVVAISADEKGVVTSVRIVKSSGLSDLDDKIVKAVRNAKFKPYKENGVAYPIQANQPFDLN